MSSVRDATLAQDAVQGFLLLSDLGSRLYLQALTQARADQRPEVAAALMNDGKSRPSIARSSLSRV